MTPYWAILVGVKMDCAAFIYEKSSIMGKIKRSFIRSPEVFLPIRQKKIHRHVSDSKKADHPYRMIGYRTRKIPSGFLLFKRITVPVPYWSCICCLFQFLDPRELFGHILAPDVSGHIRSWLNPLFSTIRS